MAPSGRRLRGQILNVKTVLAIACCLPPIAAAETFSFRAVFGLLQDRARDYSGSVSISSGEIVKVAPWRFQSGDSIDGHAWKLTVKRARFENQPDDPRPMITSPEVFNVVPAGVVVTVNGSDSGKITIKLASEEIGFTLLALKDRKVIPTSGGDVMIESALTVEQVSRVSEDKTVEQFDYPSVAAARDGSVWSAWQGYHDRGDHVYALHSTGPASPVRLTDEKADIFRTAIGEDAGGRVWVVWSQRFGARWDLVARCFEQGQWKAPQRLTSGNQPTFFTGLFPPGTARFTLSG